MKCPLPFHRSACSLTHTLTNRQWPEFAARLLCNTPADKTPLVAKERTDTVPIPLPFALSLSLSHAFFPSLCLICKVPTLLKLPLDNVNAHIRVGQPVSRWPNSLITLLSFSFFPGVSVNGQWSVVLEQAIERKTSSLFICTDDCVLDVVISFRFQLLLLIGWARHLPVFISCLTRLFHVNTSPWNGN